MITMYTNEPNAMLLTSAYLTKLISEVYWALASDFLAAAGVFSVQFVHS